MFGWQDSAVGFGDHVIVANTTFRNCNNSAVRIRATADEYVNVTFVGCTWEGNRAVGSTGGAVRLEPDVIGGGHGSQIVTVSFLNCTFSNNTADRAGGAVSIRRAIQWFAASQKPDLPPVRFVDSVFSDNKGGGYGGAISVGW